MGFYKQNLKMKSLVLILVTQTIFVLSRHDSCRSCQCVVKDDRYHAANDFIDLPPTEKREQEGSGEDPEEYENYDNNPSDGRFIIFLDMTGSMQAHRQKTIDAFNELLRDLKRKANSEMTVVRFNTHYTSDTYASVADVPELTRIDYNPGYNTALYDNLFCIIKKYENERDNRLMIISDGEDIASGFHNSDDCREMAEKLQRENNWKVSYGGAVDDPDSEADKIGVEKHMVAKIKHNAPDMVNRLPSQRKNIDCIPDTAGKQYKGTVDRTTQGRPCQRWDEDHPGYRIKSYFPHDKNHNHCRNPDNDSNGPWCYIADYDWTNPRDLTSAGIGKNFGYCTIPKCTKPRKTVKVSAHRTSEQYNMNDAFKVLAEKVLN